MTLTILAPRIASFTPEIIRLAPQIISRVPHIFLRRVHLPPAWRRQVAAPVAALVSAGPEPEPESERGAGAGVGVGRHTCAAGRPGGDDGQHICKLRVAARWRETHALGQLTPADSEPVSQAGNNHPEMMWGRG